MEVDEVEGGLLAQFGSMQTLDHDDLISQMLRLVGGSTLTTEAATFYLEMNQWNVQAAVCAYFDLEAGPEARLGPPKMTFVKDVTIGEGESVPPATRFTKTWAVTNPGADQWPQGCVLVFSSGLQMAEVGRIDVRSLAPGEQADVSVDMTSPAAPGIYESKWRMSTPSGLFFGDTIWVIITVEVAGTLALTQQMDKFNVLDQSNANHHRKSESRPRSNPFGLKSSQEDAMN